MTRSPNLFANPLFLLIGTGAGLAMISPLGKLALERGINPFLWAGLIALVPCLVLVWFVPRDRIAWTNSPLWGFGLISGILSNFIPSTILLFAIPHIGSGLAGLMFALSPVITAALSLVLKVRPPDRALLAAVAMGFVGAVLVVAGRNSLSLPSAPQWLLLALLVPLSLAVGNIYRTARWPKGASPIQVGIVVNSSVVPVFLALSFWWGGGFPELAQNPWLAIAQSAAALLNVGMFFRLQWISGPTYLSQIGYVAAAISLAIGTLALGESYPWQVWLGAALILTGLAASAWENFKPKHA
jgi:drug/metabolite transporter (DMT)-like permease